MRAIGAAVLTVLCIGAVTTVAGPVAAQEDGVPTKQVRIVNLNLLHGVFCPQETNGCQAPDRVALLMQQLEDAQCPEIVGLQEINANLAKIIDKALPKTCDGDYDVVFSKKPGTLDTERVLTTLPVKSQKIQKLTGAFRTASRVVLQSPIGPLVLVVTHQDGDPDAGAPDTPCQRTCPPVCIDGQVGVRACQTVIAAKLADDAGGEKAVRVLMGDFNVTPTSARYQRLIDEGWVDSYLAAGNAECDSATGVGCTGGQGRRRRRGPEGPEREGIGADRLHLREVGRPTARCSSTGRTTPTTMGSARSSSATSPPSTGRVASCGPPTTRESAPTSPAAHRRGAFVAHDVVIRGGTVVDGTGAPGRPADVAIDGDRIAEIGDGLRGTRELDASGQVVAPGFVDIHTHYDAQVFWDPALTPSSWHGVTSVVAGNCGFSIAPCRPEHRELIGRTLQHVEDMSLPTLQAGIPWDFESFPEYLASVERHGMALNYTAYIGHTALRLFVMGDEGYEREQPTEAELEQMAALVREAVAAGAAGFASSSAPTHNGDGGRPVPSRLANAKELEALLTPLKELDAGVGAFTPGERVSHDEVYDLQRRIGRPFTWTALLTFQGSSFARDRAARNAQERADGVDVWPQITCRPLTFQMTMADPFTFNMNPSFKALMDRPIEERLAAYHDSEWRRTAQDELEHASTFRPSWSTLTIAECPANPELEGRNIADVAAERGEEPLDRDARDRG